MKIIIYSILKTTLLLCAIYTILYYALSSRIELLLLVALSIWIVAITNMINLFDEEINDYLFKRKQAKSLNRLEDMSNGRNLAAIIGDYNEESYLTLELNKSDGTGIYCPCCDDEDD